ncbi:LysR family transcriptional regulator [Pseudoxanthomonas helianthi]|uniref:LysR family transcriptional regulator n=1 Tax=Pseudoxanthomonas helianthi TaxID=1453541 RepID=A0A941ARE5_9GAMM|nr:LysR family transcriptional regulator [Pseudoxanthomonas helianthi]MBP3982890.1 LysR family transcriptional regulator [Pseudoxanthomonas helianthi]
MITSDDLVFFNVVAGSVSLAESARKLNVTAPAVTQRLRALEQRVGMRLVERSGRRLSLTDEGALVASHGMAVVDALEALSDMLAGRRNAVSGHLHVVAPHGFGRLHVAPVVDAFARAHPGVTVALDLTDNPAAGMLESSDVIVHIGRPGPLDQIVTTLAPNRRILCASPGYLAGVPALRAPADLTRHRCLVVRENAEDVTLWRFRHATRGQATVRIHPALSSNDGAVVREWALAGQGIAIRSEWDVAADLAQGRLKQVLPGWEPPSAAVVAMLGTRHGRSARTTAFLSSLRQSLSPPPWRRKDPAGPAAGRG